jgi:hypothetical protein
MHTWSKLDAACLTINVFILRVFQASFPTGSSQTRSDNKVRELATECLPWQQWTDTSEWFDDVGISAFHSCVVVDLWQPPYEWRILLSECVAVCHRENVGTSIKFFVKLGKSGSEIRQMLVQVNGDNAMKKTAVING